MQFHEEDGQTYMAKLIDPLGKLFAKATEKGRIM
jgi:hypothetical protein